MLEGKFDALCPDICKEKTTSYLKQSNPVIEWINNNYITVTDYDKNIQDVLAKEHFEQMKKGYDTNNTSFSIGKSELFIIYSKDRLISVKLKRTDVLRKFPKYILKNASKRKG